MASSPWTRNRLERAVRESFLGDINALKPGNVHRFAGGHGMRYEDFLVSAEAAVVPLCDPALSVGQRCLAAVSATRAVVGVNTNLGMVLLFAPVVCAAQQCAGFDTLRETFRQVVDEAKESDTAAIFSAIALANPGGLGRVERHDVHVTPDCSLREAMAAAAHRDLVARQYVTAGAELFEVGLPIFQRYAAAPYGVEWATVRCYLGFLARFPDSHIVRKRDLQTARRVCRRAEAMLAEYELQHDPGAMTSQLLGLDREWKDAGINPGTSADLTAASLLLYHLEAVGRE
jgi:triphosphoribosyl-dephospho-CoA synthase